MKILIDNSLSKLLGLVNLTVLQRRFSQNLSIFAFNVFSELKKDEHSLVRLVVNFHFSLRRNFVTTAYQLYDDIESHLGNITLNNDHKI